LVTFFGRIFIEIRTLGDALSVHDRISGRLSDRAQSRCASTRMFLYTYLLFLDIPDANSHS
jgi:hypothetical protein